MHVWETIGYEMTCENFNVFPANRCRCGSDEVALTSSRRAIEYRGSHAVWLDCGDVRIEIPTARIAAQSREHEAREEVLRWSGRTVRLPRLAPCTNLVQWMRNQDSRSLRGECSHGFPARAKAKQA